MGLKPGFSNPNVSDTRSHDAILLQAEHPDAGSLEEILGNAGYHVAHYGSQKVAVLAFRDLPKLISRVRFHKANQPSLRIIAGLEKNWNEAKVTQTLGVYGVRHFYSFPLMGDAILDHVNTLAQK